MSALMLLCYGYMRKTSTFMAHQWAWQPESHHKWSGHGVNGKTCGNQELVFSPHAYTSQLCRWRDCGSTKTSPIFVCWYCNPWCESKPFEDSCQACNNFWTLWMRTSFRQQLPYTWESLDALWMVESDLNTWRTVRCHMYPMAHSTQGCVDSAMTPLGFSSSVLILSLCCNQPLQVFPSFNGRGTHLNPPEWWRPSGLSCKGETLCNVWEETKYRQKDT